MAAIETSLQHASAAGEKAPVEAEERLVLLEVDDVVSTGAGAVEDMFDFLVEFLRCEDTQ